MRADKLHLTARHIVCDRHEAETQRRCQEQVHSVQKVDARNSCTLSSLWPHVRRLLLAAHGHQDCFL